jgi:hypothetical protein
MSRDLQPSFEASLTDTVLRVFYAMEFFFDTQTLRFWSGLGDITLNGNVYTGSGSMIAISSLEETLDVAARGATLTLSGLPPDLLSLAIQEPYQGRKCNIYFGALAQGSDAQNITTEDGDFLTTQAGQRLLATLSAEDKDALTLVFSGYMDKMNIEEGPDSSIIAVYAESRLIDLRRPRTTRYTSESQKAKFPLDLGFDFVEDLQAKKFTWGRE